MRHVIEDHGMEARIGYPYFQLGAGSGVFFNGDPRYVSQFGEKTHRPLLAFVIFRAI
jgi:hypothetical protein